MQSRRGYQLLLMAQGRNGDDKENTNVNIQTQVSKHISSTKITSQELEVTSRKPYLADDKIFQYPVTYKEITNAVISFNEYGNSSTMVKKMDIEDLKKKLFFEFESPKQSRILPVDFVNLEDSVQVKNLPSIELLQYNYGEHILTPNSGPLLTSTLDDIVDSDDLVKDQDNDVPSKEPLQYYDNNTSSLNVEPLPSTSQRVIEKCYFSLNDIEDSDDSVKDQDYVPSIEPLQDHDNKTPSPNVDQLTSTSQDEIQLTKSGKIRQRKIISTTVAERDHKKELKRKIKHKVIESVTCCKKLCSQKISESDQKQINEKFWNMSWREQKIFAAERIMCKIPARRKNVDLAAENKRNKTLEYSFNQNDEKIVVCKTFFLNTLGYRKNNHSVINMAIRMKNQPDLLTDKRGINPKKKIDRKIIEEHIESFNPAISHYRREHAPKRRYLASELTVQKMYDEFCEKHSKICSYDLYRETLNSMNISFAKLGHEECERCEAFKIHNKDHLLLRHFKCDICKAHDEHVKKALQARNAYKATKINDDGDNSVYYSADLQKVIMLPRMETLKSVLFCPRIIAFNESFVPVGKSKDPPLAVLWHEATSGRKKEDILSTFRIFLLHVRDAENVILWLDNCAGQNKNWSLFSFLVYFINSGEINIKSIALKYFEPGHTFMSADSFHHQVELSMKHEGKLYDFKDFKQAVEKSNNGKVKIEEMKVTDFVFFEDCISSRKIATTKPRPYLSGMVVVKFTRGEFSLQYSDSHETENFNKLCFLKASVLKNGFSSSFLKFKQEPRGITSKRKTNILQRLCSMMPPNRVKFWSDLPVNDTAPDLTTEYDNE